MHAVAAALATIYAALVVIVLPLHGRVQYNRLLKLMESDPTRS
jgi:hypothetical protein